MTTPCFIESPTDNMADLTITGLPLEMLQMILCAAPDAPTLRNLILSHSCFYWSYLSFSDDIIGSVIDNEFSAGVIQDAMAGLEASRLLLQSNESGPGQDEEVEVARRASEVLHDYECGMLAMSSRWSLSDSLSLSKLRDHVDYFAKDFASSIGQANIVTDILDHPRIPLTRHEMNRINRSFYRYEFFCQLHQRNRSIGSNFLWNFAPWGK